TNDSSDPPDDTGESIDADGDGHTASTDCDDNDPTRYPGAEEVLDTVDNDCDGALASAMHLELPADPGSVGPVELFVRTEGDAPSVVLAWTSERCEDESAAQRACMGRRFWTPGSDEGGASGFDPQSVDHLDLGPASSGTVLDFAYAEQSITKFIRATRTDTVTTVSLSSVDGDEVFTTPFPDTYSSTATETFLSIAEAVSVDLRVLGTSPETTALGIACADGRSVELQQVTEELYATLSRDWLLDARNVRVDSCAIGLPSETSRYLTFAFALHYFDLDSAFQNQYQPVDQHMMSNAPPPSTFTVLNGTARHMDSSRIYILDPTVNSFWGVNATAHSGGLTLHRYIDTATAILNPVQMDFTISSETSDSVGLQHVGVDVINNTTAPAWVCLVDDDGAAYLGRANHSPDGLEQTFTQYPVSLDGVANTCAVSAFQGTHVVAAFDTDTGPHLVQAPLPRIDEPDD
ncbi:MAG TPA: hypothetical protein DFR83_29255, partial [Deltaproteobacteria bacterium]|nr:hypothetical protein [Deltaproteobacteria bacterium]